MADFAARLAALRANPHALQKLSRGIEKESLRISQDGSLASTRHPEALGSPLTHPSITTDFSESQLELITGVHDSAAACLDELRAIHTFVHSQLHDENLWPASMPCLVGKDDEIPIGQYGTSNIAMAKTVYRRGLGVRYGRLMQTISGIHYNFSVPEALWQTLGVEGRDEITAAYFGMIRNFRRWSWLLIYAFGASPAVCRSFTRNISHELQALDEGTMYLPHATSLRMGPLGYQSKAQSDLHISYNSLNAYATSMIQALTTGYPPYAEKGLLDEHGQHQQLNTNILQIENEFYGTIRPKRTINSGERPVHALKARGVEYVEVRCIDLNPYVDIGIDLTQANFLDTFLLMCLLADSPNDSVDESMRLLENQRAVVEQGRAPGLKLSLPEGGDIGLEEWAHALLAQCDEIADLLDTLHGGDAYRSACQAQREKVQNPEATPSARIVSDIRAQQVPFFRLAMNAAEQFHADFLARPLSAEAELKAKQQVADSHARRQAIEAQESEPFTQFLEKYLAV